MNVASSAAGSFNPIALFAMHAGAKAGVYTVLVGGAQFLVTGLLIVLAAKVVCDCLRRLNENEWRSVSGAAAEEAGQQIGSCFGSCLCGEGDD